MAPKRHEDMRAGTTTQQAPERWARETTAPARWAAARLSLLLLLALLLAHAAVLRPVHGHQQSLQPESLQAGPSPSLEWPASVSPMHRDAIDEQWAVLVESLSEALQQPDAEAKPAQTQTQQPEAPDATAAPAPAAVAEGADATAAAAATKRRHGDAGSTAAMAAAIAAMPAPLTVADGSSDEDRANRFLTFLNTKKKQLKVTKQTDRWRGRSGGSALHDCGWRGAVAHVGGARDRSARCVVVDAADGCARGVHPV